MLLHVLFEIGTQIAIWPEPFDGIDRTELDQSEASNFQIARIVLYWVYYMWLLCLHAECIIQWHDKSMISVFLHSSLVQTSLKPHPNFNQTLLTGHTQGHTRAQLAACGLSRLHVGRTWAVCGPHMDSCTRTTLGPHMAHTQAVHAAFLSWALLGSSGLPWVYSWSLFSHLL